MPTRTLTEHWRWLQAECKKIKAEYANDYKNDKTFNVILSNLELAIGTGLLLESKGPWRNVPDLKGDLADQHLTGLGPDALPLPDSKASVALAKVYIAFLQEFAAGNVTSVDKSILAELDKRKKSAVNEIEILTKRIAACEIKLTNNVIATNKLYSGLVTPNTFGIVTAAVLHPLPGKILQNSDPLMNHPSKLPPIPVKEVPKLGTITEEQLDDLTSIYDDAESEDEDTDTSDNNNSSTELEPAQWECIKLYDTMTRLFRIALGESIKAHYKIEENMVEFSSKTSCVVSAAEIKSNKVDESESQTDNAWIMVNSDDGEGKTENASSQSLNLNLVDNYERPSSYFKIESIFETIQTLVKKFEKQSYEQNAHKLSEFKKELEKISTDLEFTKNAYGRHKEETKNYTDWSDQHEREIENELSQLESHIEDANELRNSSKNEQKILSVHFETYGMPTVNKEVENLNQKIHELLEYKKNKDLLLRVCQSNRKKYIERAEGMNKKFETDISESEKKQSELSVNIRKLERVGKNIFQLTILQKLLEPENGLLNLLQNSINELNQTGEILKQNSWATYSGQVQAKLFKIDELFIKLFRDLSKLDMERSNSIFEGFDFVRYAHSVARCRETIASNWKAATKIVEDLEHVSEHRKSRRNK